VTEPAACLHPGGLDLTGRLLAEAALAPGAEVLDVGCGAGATVALLADEHGLRPTGLDASAARIRPAARARPDLRLVAGRAEQLPFPAGAFDAVVCECVLSTLEDPGAALREIARVLKPDGVALLSDVYVRAGDESPHGAVPALGGRAEVESLLGSAGLQPTLWSDESGALGRYLWDHAGGRAHTHARRPPAPEGRVLAAGARRLGYFICTARPATAAAKGA
jgi:arsenite methyltransferase